MKVLVMGGANSGKSAFAEEITAKQALRRGSELIYLATMQPSDAEDEARIVRHRKKRSKYPFRTIERHKNIGGKGVVPKGASVLLESLTSLLANEMFSGEDRKNAYLRARQGLFELFEYAEDVVVVCDYIFEDAFRYSYETELYRKYLAMLCRDAAKICGHVAEVSGGCVKWHKGGL